MSLRLIYLRFEEVSQLPVVLVHVLCFLTLHASKRRIRVNSLVGTRYKPCIN